MASLKAYLKMVVEDIGQLSCLRVISYPTRLPPLSLNATTNAANVIFFSDVEFTRNGAIIPL